MVDAALVGSGIEQVAALAAAHAGGPVAIVVAERELSVFWPPRPESDASEALEERRPKRVDGRPAGVAPGVELVVPISLGGDVIGSVSMLGGDDSVAAEAAEFLHLAALTTVMVLALEDARNPDYADGSLVEELRTNDVNGRDIVRRAARLGCDLARGAVVLVLEVRSTRPREAMALISSEQPGTLTELLGDRVYSVLPARGADEAPELTVDAARGLAARLAAHGNTAVSSFYADPEDLPRAIQEAELVLGVVSRDEQMAEEMTDGAGSGVYRLLFRALASHPEEVRSFYEDTVAAIVQYDDQYRTDLLSTLEAYLANDCNMNATARAIYAHRHTVAYRLQRVRELTRLDPMMGEDRERLSLGLKAYRMVAPTLPR
jgi:sugar diacid utilization regulator